MAWDDAPTLQFIAPNSMKLTFSGTWPSGATNSFLACGFSMDHEPYVSIAKAATTATLTGLKYGSTYQFYKSAYSSDFEQEFQSKWSSAFTVPYPTNTAVLSSKDRIAGESITFTITKGAPTYGTRVRVTGPGASNVTAVATTTANSFSWTIPVTYANSITNDTFATYTLNIDTMNGSTQVATTTQTIVVRVPNTATYNPTATITLSEVVSAINSITSGAVFVAGKSTLRVTAGGSAGTGATITKREVITGGTYTYPVTASPYYKDFVGVSAALGVVMVRITDSRGRVKEISTTPIIRAYTIPKVNSFSIARCDSEGNLANDGTYGKLILNVSATTVKAANGTTELNTMGYTVSSSPVAGSNPLRTKTQDGTLTDAYNAAVGGGNFNPNLSYVVTLTLNDRFTTGIVNTKTIPTERIPLSIGTNGIAVGKVYDDDTFALDVAGNTRIAGSLYFTGTLLPARLPAATESAIGAVERATNAEVLAGTDTTRYISPAGMKSVLGGGNTASGTSNFDPASGVTVTSFTLGRRFYLATFTLNFTYNADIPAGNIANIRIGEFNLPEFYPTWTALMTAMDTGALMGYLSTSGVLTIAWNGGAAPAGSALKLAGQYMCGYPS